MKEKPIRSLSGIPVLLGLLVLLALAVFLLLRGALFADVPLMFAILLISTGFYMVEPNQAAVLSLFGKYVGTDKGNGLR